MEGGEARPPAKGHSSDRLKFTCASRTSTSRWRCWPKVSLDSVASERVRSVGAVSPRESPGAETSATFERWPAPTFERHHLNSGRAAQSSVRRSDGQMECELTSHLMSSSSAGEGSGGSTSVDESRDVLALYHATGDAVRHGEHACGHDSVTA